MSSIDERFTVRSTIEPCADVQYIYIGLEVRAVERAKTFETSRWYPAERFPSNTSAQLPREDKSGDVSCTSSSTKYAIKRGERKKKKKEARTRPSRCCFLPSAILSRPPRVKRVTPANKRGFVTDSAQRTTEEFIDFPNPVRRTVVPFVVSRGEKHTRTLIRTRSNTQKKKASIVHNRWRNRPLS